MRVNGINGARDKALGEVVHTPSMGPHANLHQEGKAARRELMRIEWLPLKLVLPPGAATKLRCGLLSGCPVENVLTEDSPIGSSR